MTDRERSKDRPHHVQSNSGSSTPNSGTPGSGEHKGSGSGGGYFMGLFGGGSNRRTSVVPPTTSRAHATGGGSKKENAGSHGGGGAEAELDGLISPKSTSLALPGLTKSSSLRRAPSPNPPPRQTTPVTLVPFDLKSAVQAIGNAHREDDKNEGHLMETLNSTALYLASNLLERAASAAENIFAVPPHLDLEASEPSKQPLNTRVVDDADLVTLYQSVFQISNPSSSPGTRTSAIRLLAALIATYPPVYFTHNEQRTLKLPDEINVRSLYKLIISPITKTNMSTHIDAVFVQVGALKALTNSGKNVDGLDGVVGWLVRSLVDVQQEFAEWCKAKETDEQAWSKQADHTKYPDHIISANAADVAIAIIDLISSIVTTHIMLFTAQDVTRIVQPILDLISAGISSSSPTSAQQAEGPIGSTRRDSPVTSAFNSPSIVSAIGVGAGALGFEPALRQSMVISRSKADAGSLQGSSTPRNRKSHFSSSSESSPMIHQSPVPRASLSGHFDPRIPEAKWARLLPVLGSFLERLFDKATISDGLFMNVLLFICVCFGQDESALDIPEEAWTILCNILDTMLGPKGGRRAELLLHRILEGKMSASTSSQERSGTEGRNEEKVVVPDVPEVDRKLTRGAVIASRSLFPHLSSTSDDSVASSTSLSSIVPSLRAAQSTSRFMGDSKAAQRKLWQPVDYEILALLQDHLFHLESDSKSNGDAWTEGYAACELLHGMIPLVLHDKLSSSHEIRPLEAIFDGIVHQVPGAVGRLHSSTSSSPTFLHPRYIELLLDLASRLDSEDAGVVIDYYQREYLCLPFTSGWIKNIWKLIESFYLPVSASVENKRKITTLLFRDVYRYAEDLPEHRITLVEKVLVPFLETTLMDEADDNFVKEALSVLVNAAVAETMERDEEKRKRRLEKAEEGGGDLEDDLDTAPGSFDAIRKLIINLATQTQCKESSVPTLASDAQTRSASAASAPSNDASASEKRNVHKVGKDSNNPFALRGLVDALSPPSKSKELPGVTTGLVSPRSDHDSPSIMSAAQSPMLPTDQSNHPPKSPYEPAHLHCRSLTAIKSLISIFTNLAFAPPHMFVSASSVIRTPASSNSIAIYRDLLGLLYPMTDTQKKQASSAPAVQIPARCPKARLAVLQFLFRLRADSKHRVYLRPNLDKAATAFAVTLKRTKDLEEEKRQESEELQRRSSARNAERNKPADGAEERGRSSRMLESSTRSRSRSKQPASFVRTSAPEPPYNPLWRIPDELLFDVPEDVLPSEGLMTFDPNHPAWDTTESNAQAIFLPVSEYVRSLNGILRGHDWELVSYVLTFLPIQLSNKLFFHGMLATKEIKALLDALCSGVMGTNGPWDRRFNTPSFIKRADINAAAYQSLSILISYRGVFTRAECDRLVQSFIAGLQGKGELAKPCLQALSVAVFELEQSITRNLLEIVRSMISILTTTGLAVHILEFLIALGQNGSLFRNFTDEQYRLVFRVAIGYITEHNARTDQASVDLKDMVTREGYILSQHVIGLAYYAIYIWFMVLKLPQRPNLVSEITRELLKGRSQRVVVDEMAEVCFDWLARYTYGNADPKPSTSFLSEVVMNDNREGEKTEPKSLSWLLGGAIITVTSHPRSGWATITTTRPTGTTAIVCKLENVPLLDLGEANADLVSLPAVLMADRDPGRMRDDEAPEGEEPLPSARAIVDVKSSQPDPGTFDNTSQHGYIWSGATPSQRRKDVIVDPSYLALQLISSYPNASLDTPRGRLIPNEDKFSRALRGIQNTPVIDTLKIAVLYIAPGQTTETEILGNIDGSPLYLDFLSGLGRIIRLKGQVDVFVGGLNRDNDSDGEYAYAWWDDLTQTVFHIPTMMPNLPAYPNFENKKRLVGNDFVKIVYNDSGKEFNFDTIKTAWNFINVVISPYTNGLGEDELPRGITNQGWKLSEATTDTSAPGTQRRRGQDEEWLDWDREDWFKVTLQRADGIPDFSPIGTHKLVSRRALPIFVRQVAHLANDIAARFVHIRDAPDADSAEYITSWRSRLRAMHRLRTSLPPIELPDENDVASREQLLRDFTRSFSYRPAADKE